MLGGAAALVTAGVTVAMLVLPPATLSARTAQQRSVDTPTLSNATGTQDVALLGSAGVDTSQYGVKDWAAVIRQTTDTSSLVGKPVRLTGFVVPGADGTFTLTRFVISCCAVTPSPSDSGSSRTAPCRTPTSGSGSRASSRRTPTRRPTHAS